MTARPRCEPRVTHKKNPKIIILITCSLAAAAATSQTSLHSAAAVLVLLSFSRSSFVCLFLVLFSVLVTALEMGHKAINMHVKLNQVSEAQSFNCKADKGWQRCVNLAFSAVKHEDCKYLYCFVPSSFLGNC